MPGVVRLAVSAFEFNHHWSTEQMLVDMRPGFVQDLLAFFFGNATAFHQPTNRDRRASGTTGFAVNVNTMAFGDLRFDEGDRCGDVFERWMREVHRWHAKLFDTMCGVSFDGSSVLFAGVDDGFDAEFGQGVNVVRKRKRAQDNVFVDFVPPVANFQPSSEQHVPPQRWVENDVSIKPAEDVL